MHSASSLIALDGATIIANNLDVSASASTETFAGYDVFGAGWESVIAGQNVGDETNVANVTLTFAEGSGGVGSTITRDIGDWLTDHFQIGQTIAVVGSQFNDGNGYTIAQVTPTVITLAPDENLVNETDNGVATVKQLVSSVLPQNAPVLSLDPANGALDLNAAKGTLTGGAYSAWTLETALTQYLASGPLAAVLPPLLNAFFGVTAHAHTAISTLGTTAITADGSVSIQSSVVTSAVAQTPARCPRSTSG